MKKTITTIVMIGLIMLALYVSNTYTREARVDRVEGNTVVFIDLTKHEWQYEASENESYKEGQKVKLIMSNMDTTDIRDDKIMKVK